MIDQARLETILVRLAQRYAPTIAPLNWQNPGDYQGKLTDFATSLAGHNVLVMACVVPPDHSADSSIQITQWVEGFVRLYELLAGALFPSFMQISAHYADSDQPPVVYLLGSATPVLTTMAAYVTPYIASRQGRQLVTDFELMGLMDIILDELEAGDLPRDEYRRLRDDGIVFLRRLLGMNVRQLRITHPKREFASAFTLEDTDMEAPPPPVPAPPAPPETPPPPVGELVDTETMPAPPVTPPPPDLPEQERLDNKPFGTEIPIFFERKRRDDGKAPPRPPVPDLPE